ncbi:MAG: MoaD/ThiS family protein [Gammaproteobacteria bacterium]
MRVFVSSHMRHYTEGCEEIDARGATLKQVLRDLDRRYPGLQFRLVDEQDHVRPHIRLFVNGAATRDLRQRLSAKDEIHILGALSGG